MPMLSDGEPGCAASADDNSLASLSAVAASRGVYRWWQRCSLLPSTTPATPQLTPKRADRAGRKAQLRAAISSLTPEQREVVRLRFIEGHSLDQIAARTGLSHSAIKALQVRALAILAHLLDDA